MSFQIHSVSPKEFQPLFAMSDRELAEHRACKIKVDSQPGYPCRISLEDAEIGEEVVLVNYEHLPAESPFRSSHAIYVRENTEQAFPEAGTIPDLLKSRLISIRAFDISDFMINADVVDGSALETVIPTMLQDAKVECLHLHNARLGCFLARVTRGHY